MNINKILTACAKTTIAVVIAFAICALILCFTSCSSRRTFIDTSHHVSDTTHVTIFHDSVRVTLRDTTIVNYRDSTIIHTKVIEQYDPSTGNITNRETDKYESIYHEYIDRSSRTIDSLQHIIDSSIDSSHVADAELVATDTKRPSGTTTSICVCLIVLVVLACIITYRHEQHKLQNK